jgi:hypothetical protein
MSKPVCENHGLLILMCCCLLVLMSKGILGVIDIDKRGVSVPCRQSMLNRCTVQFVPTGTSLGVCRALFLSAVCPRFCRQVFLSMGLFSISNHLCKMNALRALGWSAGSCARSLDYNYNVLRSFCVSYGGTYLSTQFSAQW